MDDRTMLVGTEVPEAFDSAAERYDLMVALNPGYHRHLTDAADALVERLPLSDDPVRVVDLGCGSGASTLALVRTLERRCRRPFDLLGLDGSTGMLERARQKSWPEGVRFEHRLAENLTASGNHGHVGGVFAAYLFRNVSDRDQVLAAVHDLLTPGGVLVVHEYSVAGSRRARLLWTLVCWLVVIPLSWLVSRETSLYRYLWRSVLVNETVEHFTGRMHRAGFVKVETRTVRGWQRGILHTIRGHRPDAPR